jgi:TRAP-type C4-dicarboxylate transport system permease small subunit
MMLWTTARQVIQRMTYALCFIGMFLLVPMMLVTTADVFGRTVWARPIPGTVELSSYMLAVFVLLGVAYTHQVKGHVRVSIFVSRIPQRARTLLDVITTLMSLGIIAIVAWQGWVVAVEERTVSDMLRIPQWPFRMLVSLAGLFLAAELMIDLSTSLGKLFRR